MYMKNLKILMTTALIYMHLHYIVTNGRGYIIYLSVSQTRVPQKPPRDVRQMVKRTVE